VSEVSKYRRGGKPDANQGPIVDALRGVGATVQVLSEVGHGCPDLLVGWRGRTYLFEVKTESGALNENEAEWATSWRGERVKVVRSTQSALAAIGVTP
jgi:hypothetical protein